MVKAIINRTNFGLFDYFTTLSKHREWVNNGSKEWWFANAATFMTSQGHVTNGVEYKPIPLTATHPPFLKKGGLKLNLKQLSRDIVYIT